METKKFTNVELDLMAKRFKTLAWNRYFEETRGDDKLINFTYDKGVTIQHILDKETYLRWRKIKPSIKDLNKNEN